MPATDRVAVVGLGYVGLPLAVALSRHVGTVGFDIDESRIEELRAGRDRDGEVTDKALKDSPLTFGADPAVMTGAGIFIIATPTPVDDDNRPDLSAVEAACDTVGRIMRPGAIVVFESTVYPGVTEDVCGPRLEEASGLVCGEDFFLGYSPERINPGDREHTVERITKVVAGQTPQVVDVLTALYGTVTAGGVHVAKDIKTAEAAKVIENAQRDINIAFINEVSMIFDRLGISIHDVLETSATKWNFLDFKPGLVGGHCIGVDPFYLAHCGLEFGHNPEIILAGRRINDGMGAYVAGRILDALATASSDKTSRVLVLGLTFKENVPDLRNSKVIDVIRGLAAAGLTVDVHDPIADSAAAKQLYGVDLVPGLDGLEAYDGVIGAVSHAVYRALDGADLAGLVKPGGLIADIKGMWRDVTLPDGLHHWQL